MKIRFEQKPLTLSLSPIPKLPNTLLDKPRLEQVLRNLLDNALKFTPDGGRVQVRVKKLDKNVVVTVKDTGIGIKPANLEKLFIPFYQVDSGLDRKLGGSGLGLSISRGIVEAHGGKLWATSRGHNKGSTFSISVPIKATKKIN